MFLDESDESSKKNEQHTTIPVMTLHESYRTCNVKLHQRANSKQLLKRDDRQFDIDL